MTRLEREGRVVAARGEGGFAPVQRRAGALNRFLAARGE
jgi:hypothetical protein